MGLFRKKKRKTQTRMKAVRQRPRLRSVVSRNIVSRYHDEKRNRHRRRSGRTVVLALLIGIAGFMAVKSGLFTPLLESGKRTAASLKARVLPDIPQMAKKKNPAPLNSRSLGGSTVPAGLTDRVARFFGRAPQPAPEVPAALVRLDRVYPIDSAGRVLPVRREQWYDLPVLTGLEGSGVGPGDTLAAARLALDAVGAARVRAPALYNRLSELMVTAPGAVTCLFRDRALRALLGPESLPLQVVNLWSFIETQDTVKTGTLNLSYGRIAFLTEEE